jgi:ribosomal protein L37AE/L43A
MAINRVQFQRGLPMSEFFELYGTREKCEAALQASRWPGGFECPDCGGPARSSFRREGRLYWQCSRCPHQCSLTSDTIFHRSKLPLTTWFLAMHLLTQAKNNVSALELKRHLGVNYATAWLVKHKIMEVMRLTEDDRQLTGRVEIDDAYLGGQRSGGKAGRGSENKIPFVAAVQTTEAGDPHLVCLSQRPFTKQAMDGFLARSTALPLTLVSDGLGCFAVSADHGAVHDRTVTGGGKASMEIQKLRCVNTVLGNLKTALTGTYHAVRFEKYAARYLAELQYRFNRRYDLRSILSGLLRDAATTMPHRECFLRVAEASR